MSRLSPEQAYYCYRDSVNSKLFREYARVSQECARRAAERESGIFLARSHDYWQGSADAYALLADALRAERARADHPLIRGSHMLDALRAELEGEG